MLGRPTKYSEEMLQKTQEYINECEDKYEIVPVDGDEKQTRTIHKVNLPTIEGLAYNLKVNKTTIYEWCKSHEDFSNVIDDLMAKQAKMLVSKGLSGDYSQVIAKVLLTKHGYREGLEHTGKEGEALFNDEHKAKANKALDDILGQGNTEQGG